MKKPFFFFLACVMLAVALPAAAASVPTLNMASFTDLLLKNRGKVILVNFFATWCPPCRLEIPELVQISKAYNDKNVLVLSLSVDEQAAAVPPFRKKMEMDYPVFMAGKDVVKAFRVTGIPHNALYDKQGKRIFSEDGMLDAATVSSMLDALLEK